MPSSERQEVELKYVLPNAAALESLGRLVGGSPSAPVTQVNHFFDTPAFRLRQQKFVLRLREEQGHYFLTGKGPSLAGSSDFLSRKEEAEVALDSATAQALLEGRQDPLEVLERSNARLENPSLLRSMREALGKEPAGHVGSFVNRRTRLDWRPRAALPALTLELDETLFPGDRVDCEVEVEVHPPHQPEEVQRELERLLGSLGIAPQSAPGKAKRFFKILASKG